MDILNELNEFLNNEPEVEDRSSTGILRTIGKLDKLISDEDGSEYSYTDIIKQIDTQFNQGRITKEVWSDAIKVLEHIREEERSHKYQLKKLIDKLNRRIK